GSPSTAREGHSPRLTGRRLCPASCETACVLEIMPRPGRDAPGTSRADLPVLFRVVDVRLTEVTCGSQLPRPIDPTDRPLVVRPPSLAGIGWSHASCQDRLHPRPLDLDLRQHP